MGQRLVITIIQNQEEIAKIYYHWSAYTRSALEEARELIDWIGENGSGYQDLRLACVKYVEIRGGCIDGGGNSSEYEEIQKMYPNEQFSMIGSRNLGLIALTSEGMNVIQGISEGDMEINFDTRVVTNWVVWDSDDLQSFATDDKPLDETGIVKLYSGFGTIPFEDLSAAIEGADLAVSSGSYILVDETGTYYQLIE